MRHGRRTLRRRAAPSRGFPYRKLLPRSSPGSRMITSTARNCFGVSSRTAFVGSPTSSAGSRRTAARGASRGSPRTSSTRPRSPPVNSATTEPACGSSTRTAVSTACETTASVWCPRRRANRCCDQPPAAVRPWTWRASTFETTRSVPSNSPTAQRPRRTSSTAARCDCRASAVKPLSRAGPGVQSNGARRVTVVESAQVTCRAPSRSPTSVKAPCRSATPSSHFPSRSGATPRRRPRRRRDGDGSRRGSHAARSGRRTLATGRPSAAHASKPPTTSTARCRPRVRSVSATRLEL